MNFYLILSYRPPISVADHRLCMECGVAVPTKKPEPVKGKKKIKVGEEPESYDSTLEGEVIAEMRERARKGESI